MRRDQAGATGPYLGKAVPTSDETELSNREYGRIDTHPRARPMQRITFVLALGVGLSSVATAQDFTAPRSATVPTAGVQRIEVLARAGTLRIDGRAGIREVRVTGTARA